MKKDILKKLQLTELDILKEIDRICKKYDIKYFLMYGTLLGAVRHKGFIPWDDDIDIGMLQEDYSKFIKVAPKELKDKFHLDAIETNSKYYLPFIKVRNKLTKFEESSTVNYNGEKGIWVDIFPFYYTSYNNANRIIKFKAKVLCFLYGCLVEKSFKNGKGSFLLKFIVKFASNKFLLTLIKLISFKKRKTDNIIFYGFEGVDASIVYSKEDFIPFDYLDFEDNKFPIPKNYDNVLSKLYGDYMKLPPVDKRITHSPLKIVFEDGMEINLKNLNDKEK